MLGVRHELRCLDPEPVPRRLYAEVEDVLNEEFYHLQFASCC